MKCLKNDCNSTLRNHVRLFYKSMTLEDFMRTVGNIAAQAGINSGNVISLFNYEKTRPQYASKSVDDMKTIFLEKMNQVAITDSVNFNGDKCECLDFIEFWYADSSILIK